MSDGEQFDPLEFELPDDNAADQDLTPSLSDSDDMASGIEEEPVVATKKSKKKGKKAKKEKTPKAKKEKTPKAKKEKAPKAKKTPKPIKEKKAPAEKAGFPIAMLAFLVVALVGLVGLNIYVLANGSFIFLVFMNVIALTAIAVPAVMCLGRATLSFYEVALGLALVAILVSISCLLIEVSRYGGHLKADSISRRPTLEAPVHASAPLNTKAVA